MTLRRLTAGETRLFDLIRNVTNTYRLDVVVRVAGGWVRDAIMNEMPVSDDIDLAVSGPRPPWPPEVYDTAEGTSVIPNNEREYITGTEFAWYIVSYLKRHDDTAAKVYTIQENPEQSKHLECAKMMLFGLDLDIVHLRKEDYASHSRIPTISHTRATPLEDAQRRDLTINSMFYNVHTNEIEDPTGMGLQDIQNQIIRTPLARARETFKDDPLRILRAIRFACRLNFNMWPEMVAEVQQHSTEIAHDLRSKVSRERIGIEVGKMFEGQYPVRACQIMKDFGVAPVVFCQYLGNPKKQNEKGGDRAGDTVTWNEREWSLALGTMSMTIAVTGIASMYSKLSYFPIKDGEPVPHLREARLLAGLLCYPAAQHITKHLSELQWIKRPESNIESIAVQLATAHRNFQEFTDNVSTNGLKWGVIISQLTSGILLAGYVGEMILERLEALNASNQYGDLLAEPSVSLTADPTNSLRSLIGEWMRGCTVNIPEGKYSLWAEGLLLSLELRSETIKLRDDNNTFRYEHLLKEFQDIARASLVSPLFNGKELMQILGEQGPIIGNCQIYLHRLQAVAPSLCTTDEGKETIKNLLKQRHYTVTPSKKQKQ